MSTITITARNKTATEIPPTIGNASDEDGSASVSVRHSAK